MVIFWYYDVWNLEFDKDDLIVEDEMRKFGLWCKDIELVVRILDVFCKCVLVKECVSF